MKLLQFFQTLKERDFLTLFLLNQRYLNPLIPAEYQILDQEGLLEDPFLQKVVQCLLDSESQLPPATYFPTPIIRSMQTGKPFTLELARQFSYSFIQVDTQQNWSLQGKSLDHRIKKHFLDNLYYEAAIQRYYVEYKVDKRMDKCYLKCDITPMLGLQIIPESAWSDCRTGILDDTDNSGRPSVPVWQVQLNNDKMDTVDLNSFQLNEKEQLFCQTENHGEVLLDENTRYFILKNIQEDGESFSLDGQLHPLSTRPIVD